jgi:isoquinoline 1-oxidoreductase beta subunit
LVINSGALGINVGNQQEKIIFLLRAVDNLLIDSVQHQSPITTAPWRAPITNFLAFAGTKFY